MKYSFITLFCLQTGSYCVHHMVQVIPLPQSPKTLGKGGHHCVSLFWGERRAVVVKKLSFMKRTCSKVLCRLLKTETTMPTCYFQDVEGVSCEQELTYNWPVLCKCQPNANNLSPRSCSLRALSAILLWLLPSDTQDPSPPCKYVYLCNLNKKLKLSSTKKPRNAAPLPSLPLKWSPSRRSVDVLSHFLLPSWTIIITLWLLSGAHFSRHCSLLTWHPCGVWQCSKLSFSSLILSLPNAVTLWPFNTVPRVMVAPNHQIISLLFKTAICCCYES